jgi:hypothetical protein
MLRILDFIFAAAVTLVGRFLRRTKLDELPKFWGVLTDEKSLAGSGGAFAWWRWTAPDRAELAGKKALGWGRKS